MSNAVTPWTGLPLPDPEHTLEYDVLRLISALNSIDGLLHILGEATASDDPGGLGSVQALVDAVRTLRTQMQAAQSELLQLTPAVSGTLSYSVTGALDSLTETLPGGVERLTTYAYTNDTLSAAIMTVAGTTYRTTYQYTNGVLTGMLREILP